MTIDKLWRRRAAGALVCALALALAAGGGCGKDQKATPVPQAASRLVPARADSADTTAADVAATPTEAAPQPTLTPPGTSQLADSAAAATQRRETSPAVRAAAGAATGTYALQLGSFVRESNARELAARLTRLGYAPQVEVAVLGGQTYHRVFLRGLPDKAAARRLGEKIRAELGLAYLIRQAD